MQRSPSTRVLRIHICTTADEKFSGFRVTTVSRKMQRSPITIILRIHIHAITQELFHGFNIAFYARLMECFIEYIFYE